jgi:hypothetical protein
VRKIIHHTLGDGEFQNFANISAQASCVRSVITPDNCAHEMERLIATARAESRPAYILVASDHAVTPVTACDPVPYPRPKSGPDLAKADAAIAERIEAARSLAILPAYTVSRFKLSAGPPGPCWVSPPRANRRATSRSLEAGWTSRRDSPWHTSVSTPCAGTVRHPVSG